MKMTFEAIAERVTPDQVIGMIIDELNGKKPSAEVKEETKKGKFGRK